MDKKKIVAVGLAVAGAGLGGMLLSRPSSAAPGWARTGDTLEKCAGVVRQGGNDCGANGHDCSGHAAQDDDPNEWVYLPAGVCERLSGGRVILTKVLE